MSKKKLLQPLTEDELEPSGRAIQAAGRTDAVEDLQSVCHEPRTVNDIVKATGSTQANVSKHLALLAAGGHPGAEKDGQCVYYGMKDKLVVQLCELVRAQIAEKKSIR